MRTELDSKGLSACEYEPGADGLTIEFRDGSVHHYPDVPASNVALFIASDSKGKSFNKHIRGKFPYQKIRGAYGG